MKIPQKIKNQIDNIIDIEGGYVNHPDDPGGATKYGITERVARNYGYQGDMRDLPVETAREIYYNQYIIEPKFDRLTNPQIQYEAFEQGVNMGQNRAVRHLQEAYNAIHYQTIQVDGMVGNQTLKAVNNSPYQHDIYKIMNILQGAYYIKLTQQNSKYKSFIRGWVRHRVIIEEGL
jgi:lysozyme family protein